MYTHVTLILANHKVMECIHWVCRQNANSQTTSEPQLGLYWNNGNNCRQFLHPQLWIPTPSTLLSTHSRKHSFPGGPGGLWETRPEEGTFSVPPCSCLPLPGLPGKPKDRTESGVSCWALEKELRLLNHSLPQIQSSARSRVLTPTASSFLHLLKEHLKEAELEKEVKEGGPGARVALTFFLSQYFYLVFVSLLPLPIMGIWTDMCLTFKWNSAGNPTGLINDKLLQTTLIIKALSEVSGYRTQSILNKDIYPLLI